MGDVMKYKNLIKSNLKFIIAMTVVIALGAVGITFAINIDTFNPIGINIGTATLGANITYLNGSSATITSTGKLLPINDDKTEITPDSTNESILKIDFKLSGTSTNPDNTIMDISLNNISMDCELKSEYFKWKLYKEEALLSSGSFSPKFDSMKNNRLVLTNTQERLTTNEDKYTLLIYLAESCTGDLSTCNANSGSYNQETLLNKNFSATMKVELSTGNKKTNTRSTSSTSACSYTSVSVPTCNTLTYNGSSRTLITTNAKYTLTNNTGTNAGNYVVIAELKSDYKWPDGTKVAKSITCNIAKKDVTITPIAQTIAHGGNVVSDISKVTASGLVSGHSISHVHLSTRNYNVGTGTINASAARIKDSSSNDVLIIIILFMPQVQLLFSNYENKLNVCSFFFS